MPLKLMNVFAHSIILSYLISVSATPSLVHARQTRHNSRAIAQSQSVESDRSLDLRKYRCGILPSASAFARTELFFGSLKPNGTQVSDAEFQAFLNRDITPRFPDGLTLLAGFGQFKNSQGVVIQERSRLLILLYPIEQAKDSNWKIERIRKTYNQAFQQESVLRTDELSCVSF